MRVAVIDSSGLFDKRVVAESNLRDSSSYLEYVTASPETVKEHFSSMGFDGYVIVPVTDWKPVFANLSWFTFIAATPANGLAKDSGADAFQVKSVAETRFSTRLGTVTPTQLDEIASAVALCVSAP